MKKVATTILKSINKPCGSWNCLSVSINRHGKRTVYINGIKQQKHQPPEPKR